MFHALRNPISACFLLLRSFYHKVQIIIWVASNHIIVKLELSFATSERMACSVRRKNRSDDSFKHLLLALLQNTISLQREQPRLTFFVRQVQPSVGLALDLRQLGFILSRVDRGDIRQLALRMLVKVQFGLDAAVLATVAKP